nr:ABC transporter ATP-binding protein [uncultured Albidiferax sp.]
MSQVRLVHIKKSYGSHVALQDIHLNIAMGAFFTLLGPSGCGKTTLLRAIAGFHQQDSGEIWVGDESIGQLPANKRQVGMVFQDYAVFPHLSVFDNVAFGLVQQKCPAADIQQRVAHILNTVQLGAHAQRMPHQLSGGQQQRVGLARALVIRPKLLLMDEPLSNLDAKLRVDLRRDIRLLQQEFGLTTVYVTHDQEEALSISDQVCVMYDGVVQQLGTPWQVYNHSANRFVATFVGSNNFFTATLDGERLRIADQHIAAPQGVRGLPRCVAAIRPEKIRVNQALTGPGLALAGVLRQAMFTGRELQLSVDVAGLGMVEALTAPNEAMVALKPGDTVQLGVHGSDFLFYAEGDTGKLLP